MYICIYQILYQTILGSNSLSFCLLMMVSTSLCSSPVIHLVAERVIFLEVYSTTSIPM